MALQIERGVKCIDLAKAVGVSKSQVTRWRQSSDIKISVLTSICAALGVSLSEFLTEKSPDKSGQVSGGECI